MELRVTRELLAQLALPDVKDPQDPLDSLETWAHKDIRDSQV